MQVFFYHSCQVALTTFQKTFVSQRCLDFLQRLKYRSTVSAYRSFLVGSRNIQLGF